MSVFESVFEPIFERVPVRVPTGYPSRPARFGSGSARDAPASAWSAVKARRLGWLRRAARPRVRLGRSSGEGPFLCAFRWRSTAGEVQRSRFGVAGLS